MPSLAAISFSAEAISSACARLSIWQGPANTAIGRSLANVTLPIVTAALGFAESLMTSTIARAERVAAVAEPRPRRSALRALAHGLGTLARRRRVARQMIVDLE